MNIYKVPIPVIWCTWQPVYLPGGGALHMIRGFSKPEYAEALAEHNGSLSPVTMDGKGETFTPYVWFYDEQDALMFKLRYSEQLA